MSTQSISVADSNSIEASGESAFEMPVSRRGTPTWEMALNYPRQGEWSEEEYLSLNSNRLIEFTDGVLEFLPMPTWIHQWLVDFLHSALKQFVESRRLGRTAFAPVRVRLRDGKCREPDVVYVTVARLSDPRKPSEGADLVMEVVSEDGSDRQRDYVDKRSDYAEAGIPEYWIVDPETETITVLTLDGAEYKVHGEFHPTRKATSVLLPGFEVDVTACFEFAKPTDTE